MVYICLLALVVLSPLPFGAVHPWAWSSIACVVGLLLAAHALLVAGGRTQPGLGLARAWPLLLPGGLTAIWVGLQATGLSPGSWHHPLWGQAASVLGVPVSSAVSLDPSETVSGLIRLLAYAGLFWLSLELCRSAERARHACLVFVCAASAYSTYGLVAELSGATSILWFEANPAPTRATFVNYNSFATYAGLGLVCATGLLLLQFGGDLWDHLSWRRRLNSVVQSMSVQGALILLAWVVLATALLRSTSRGGFLSATLGLAAMLVAYGLVRSMRVGSTIAMAAPLVAAGFLLYLYSGEITDIRLARWAPDSEGRTHIYGLVVDAIGERPVLGTGYGTFADVFRLRRDEFLAREVVKAHNTYLEIGLELGLPAAALLVLASTLAFARCIAGIVTRRRHIVYPCIGVGATVLVGAHALVDFSLQIPAIAVTYVFLMGLAVAQSWPSGER